MRALSVLFFLGFLVPIYVLPWLPDNNVWLLALAPDDDDLAGSVASGRLVLAACYCGATLAAYLAGKGARWTALLVVGAGLFDLVLFFVPFVPTVLLLVAFIFIAKGGDQRRPPQRSA